VCRVQHAECAVYFQRRVPWKAEVTIVSHDDQRDIKSRQPMDSPMHRNDSSVSCVMRSRRAARQPLASRLCHAHPAAQVVLVPSNRSPETRGFVGASHPQHLSFPRRRESRASNGRNRMRFRLCHALFVPISLRSEIRDSIITIRSAAPVASVLSDRSPETRGFVGCVIHSSSLVPLSPKPYPLTPK
jgi:hypothetical protein